MATEKVDAGQVKGSETPRKRQRNHKGRQSMATEKALQCGPEKGG